MASAERCSLRAIGRADLPAIAALLREPWPEVEWERRFERQWFDNPAWDEELVMGWAHETDEGLESFFGSIPVNYWIRGEPGRALAATALYVRPKLRRRGLARELVLAWLAQEGGGLCINSTSNEVSAGIFDGLEMGEKRRSETDREAFVVARPFAYARGRAAARLGKGALAALGRVPLTLAGGAALWFRRPRIRSASAWSWELLHEAGVELDELWERERPADRATLRRDAETLHWLYFEGPRAEDNCLLLGRDGAGGARALAGFHRERDPSLLRQLDLFGELDPDAWAALVPTATRLAADRGVELVRFWTGDERASRILGELGLETRPCSGAVDYQERGPGEPRNEPLFTDLDGDRCVELLL